MPNRWKLPFGVFLEANRLPPGHRNYAERLLSIDTERAVEAGGISLLADSSIFDDEEDIGTLLVAGTLDYPKLTR
jgi:hypothetical protein